MIPRTSAFAWAATFLGLSGPFTEPMYFRARSSRVFALRGRRVIARMSDRFMGNPASEIEFYYAQAPNRNEKGLHHCKPLDCLARPERFELATPCFVANSACPRSYNAGEVTRCSP